MIDQNTAVVILNWNGVGFLKKFLPSVIKHSEGARIIVADNASTDDSISFLKANFPDVELVINKENGGFAKGYNDALKQIDAKYYVLLNSDVEVTSNWLEPVISLMESDRNIAACQPKILAFDRMDEFEYAGACGGFIDKYGYPFCRGRIFHVSEKDSGQYDQEIEIFWATGACMFVRAEEYHQAGGFDEDYFAHMEEIDLCWRMKNMGRKIMVVPTSVVYHVGGGTLNKTSPHKTYLNFRNNLITFVKNHAPEYLIPKIILRLILDGIAGAKFFFSGEFAHCFAIIRAHFAFYKTIGRTLNKRREIVSNPHFKPAGTGVLDANIVFQFYLMGRKKFSDLKF